MNREQAQFAIEQGQKLTWTHFSSDEWVMGLEDGYYLFEDGCQCTPEEFWQSRTSPEWNEGWKIYDN